ncbi:hypothetical protein [Micromonospora sp. NPDC049374]|uniref:hypothetical protein n=1 Tax=Micromonospora sp. NPDC049374 TaxID=3154352 RepID=UPI00341E0692
MSLQIVRFNTEAPQVPRVEEALRKLFAAIEAAAPTGIDYTAVRVGDGPEFLLTLQLAGAGANPLLDIPEALAFRTEIARWANGPVPPQPATVLGRYSR